MTDKIDVQLQYIFSNINDWLKFAEAKNGALIAANIAIIAAVMQSLATFQPNLYLEIYLIAMVVFCIISAIVALISFLPIMRIPWLRKPPAY